MANSEFDPSMKGNENAAPQVGEESHPFQNTLNTSSQSNITENAMQTPLSRRILFKGILGATIGGVVGASKFGRVDNPSAQAVSLPQGESNNSQSQFGSNQVAQYDSAGTAVLQNASEQTQAASVENQVAQYESLSMAEIPAWAQQSIFNVWNRTDGPVADGTVERSWYWGPEVRAVQIEQYEGAKDGGSGESGIRLVAYFDKSRMEITHPDGDKNSEWFVTNGLLAKELVTGQIQIGDNSFDQRAPAPVNVAGDFNDPNAPTYASFHDHVAPTDQLAAGTNVTAKIDRNGNVTFGHESDGVIITDFVPDTGHNIPGVFMNFLEAQGVVYDKDGNTKTDQLQPNPFYATGYPITEPYWTSIMVGGVQKDVLVQVFERRVLTYTPSNDKEWQVEAGNVGLQYYEYRYGQLPDSIIQENVDRDFNVHKGNGWEIDSSKDSKIQMTPTNPGNLDKLPDMLTAMDPSFKGKRLRIVIGSSKDQLVEDIGVPAGEFQPVSYVNLDTQGQIIDGIGEAPQNDINGDRLPGTFVISLSPDVLARIGNDINGLNEFLAAEGVNNLFGQKMLEKLGYQALETVFKYFSANTQTVNQ